MRVIWMRIGQMISLQNINLFFISVLTDIIL